MYSVYADSVCIYNDAFALDNMKLASPKLTLEDNAAGSFVMTVPPSNLGYSTIIRMVTDIAVHKDGKRSGRGASSLKTRTFTETGCLLVRASLHSSTTARSRLLSTPEGRSVSTLRR